MTDRDQVDPNAALPYGATEIRLGALTYSDALAVRLADSGASDEAIDAAGGPGTAERLGADAPANEKPLVAAT
jgi:hypothetical protein